MFFGPIWFTMFGPSLLKLRNEVKVYGLNDTKLKNAFILDSPWTSIK